MNDLLKGNKIDLPDKLPDDVPEVRQRSGVLTIFRGIVRWFFPRKATSQMFKFKRKRTKADGSSVETEIIYRKDC